MYCSPCGTIGKVHPAFILFNMHNVCHTRSSPCLSVCKTVFHHFTSRHDCSNQKELIYTYDGLYEVTAADMVTGQEGFKICKSVYQPSQANFSSAILTLWRCCHCFLRPALHSACFCACSLKQCRTDPAGRSLSLLQSGSSHDHGALPLPALHCYVLHTKHLACGLCTSDLGTRMILLDRGGKSMNNRRFKLKALVGHSKAGQKVTYGAIKGAKFKQLALVHALSLPCCAPWHTCCNTRLA